MTVAQGAHTQTCMITISLTEGSMDGIQPKGRPKKWSEHETVMIILSNPFIFSVL